MGFIGFNFNLVDQLSFYGFYHQKHGNQIIHFFFVPSILWSAAVFLAYSGSLADTDLPSHLHFLPPVIAQAATFNLAAVGIWAFTAYFAALEPFAGLSWSACIGLPAWLSASWMVQHVPQAWAWALGVHVISWLAQVVVGHIMIEGRKPALLDSLFQSLVLASLFAWMEMLFALGYRPKLQEDLRKRIADKKASFQTQYGASEPLLTSATVSAQ